MQRRLAQNREAARKSRQRKKDYMKQLEVEVHSTTVPPPTHPFFLHLLTTATTTHILCRLCLCVAGDSEAD